MVALRCPSRRTDRYVTIEVRAGKTILLGSAMRQVCDGCGCDITTPTIFQGHGDAHRNAKIPSLLRFGKPSEFANL